MPVGNFIPISQVRDDVAAAYKKEKEWQTLQMLLPFKSICTRKKVSLVPCKTVCSQIKFMK
jgi:hypothetical protein